MKRREFIRNIAAVAATPALPIKVFAGNSAISAAVYAKAVHYAKLWNTSVPEMYTSALGLSHEDAQSVFDRLVSERILEKPDIIGIGKAAFPYFKSPTVINKTADLLNNIGKNTQSKRNAYDQGTINTIKKTVFDDPEPDHISAETDEKEDT
jgi:hypothetical protein